MTETSSGELERTINTPETEVSKIPEYNFAEGLDHLVDLVLARLNGKNLVRVGFVSLSWDDINIGKTYLRGKLSERLQLAGCEVVSTGTDSFEDRADKELEMRMKLHRVDKGIRITESVASIDSTEYGESSGLRDYLRSSYDVIVGLCRLDRQNTRFSGADLVIINEGAVDKNNKFKK